MLRCDEDFGRDCLLVRAGKERLDRMLMITLMMLHWYKKSRRIERENCIDQNSFIILFRQSKAKLLDFFIQSNQNFFIMFVATFTSPLKDDEVLFCANFLTILFDKLIERDPQELAKLLSVEKKEGFFYFDLIKAESQRLWKDYKKILIFMKTWFNQPLDEKLQYAYNSNTQRYVWIYHQVKIIRSVSKKLISWKKKGTSLLRRKQMQSRISKMNSNHFEYFNLFFPLIIKSPQHLIFFRSHKPISLEPKNRSLLLSSRTKFSSKPLSSRRAFT